MQTCTWSSHNDTYALFGLMAEVAQLNLDKLADRAKRGVIIGEGDNR